MKKLSVFLTVLMLVSVAVGCAQKTVTPTTQVAPQPIAASTDHRPYWPTQEWQVTTPERQGMDSAILDRISGYIKDSGIEVNSVIVIRHGYLVYEKYFRAPWDKDRIHNIYSCTKSIMSSLVGIAIQQGKIKSLNDKMLDYFPNRTIKNLDERKKSITLLNLMTMKAGFDWAEWTYSYTDPRNPIFQAHLSNDFVQFVLDRPMATQPGTIWAYNGGGSQILSAILTNKTGISALDFARKNLFGPLGIKKLNWRTDQKGIYDAGGGLSLTPRDIAKYGYLILNRGGWEGKQIIPVDFVGESVKTHTTFSANSGFGYQNWWTIPLDGYYYSGGIRGQRIYVMEKQDMVVVTTASLQEELKTEIQMRKIAVYAISACKS